MKLRIRELREEKNLTQVEVANYLHCHPSLYGEYEREEREIPIELIVALSRYYGTSMDYALGQVEDRRPFPPPRDKT